MIKKIFLSVGAYLLLCIWGLLSFSACDNCAGIKGYFDFTDAEILVENANLGANDTLIFYLHYEDLEYLSEYQPASDWNLMSTATAKCIAEGGAGLKYPITEIDFLTTVDYDSSHLHNSSLNNLIEINVGNGFEPASNELLNTLNRQDYYQPYQLRLSTAPTLTDNFQLQLRIKKEEGSEVFALSPAIYWQ